MTYPDYSLETEYSKMGYTCICGTDEAGRGPLAGDVFAAAVILPVGTVIEGLNDSKKLSEKKREMLFDVIIEKATAYCIARSSVEEIDSLNILNASLLAMRRAIAGLDAKVDFVLVDGNICRDFEQDAKAVIGGDGKSMSIAAASILAKVARDRYCKEMDAMYPQYSFAAHKGYGTKAHRAAILEYGACPLHRKTFLKKIAYEKQ